MKKIDFKSPRYIIPLIILPFLFGINWIWIDSFSAGASPMTAKEELEMLNTNIPDASLEKKDLDTKFEAIRKAFKDRRDFSAINDLEDKHRAFELEEGKYSEEERHLIDSINNSIMDGSKKGFVEEVKSRTKSRKPQSPALENGMAEETTKVTGTAVHDPTMAIETQEERELRLWKEQILMIDSLTKTPEERATAQMLREQEQLLKAMAEKEALEKEKIVNVSKAGNANERFFNTVRKKEKETYIKAIIDEDIKVADGSRVRIRIMDDIDVGGYILEKGAYVFANISSFSEQRVNIAIESILVDNMIMKVDLEVYDNDGLKGLYVPNSSFTEFTKDLGSSLATGSSSDIKVEEKPGNLNQFLFGVAETGVKTGSKATSKAARKNRAKLKYNTIIYLVNSEQL